MGLSQALSAALAGVKATQQALSVISGNVANANTAGYVDESISQACGRDRRATGRQRRHDRHQPQSQFAAAKPIVDRKLRRVLCRHHVAALSAAPAGLWNAGLVELVRRHLQQFHQRRAGALDQPQLVFRANPGAHCRTGADAKPRRHDQHRPAIAHPGGAGHRHRRADRQYRDRADRPDQPAARISAAGQRHRDAGRPA